MSKKHLVEFNHSKCSYRFAQHQKIYLKNVRKEQSTKYLQELSKTLLLLSDSLSIGTLRTDISLTTFSFPYASHIIYYTLDNDFLIIFTVLHKTMVPVKHIASRFTHYA